MKKCASILVLSIALSPLLVLATQSASFDRASNQYLSVTSGTGTALDVAGDFSMLAWVKLATLPYNSQYIVAGKHNNANASSAYLLQIFDRTGSGNYGLGANLINGSGSGSWQPEVSWTPSVDVWYQIGMTYSSSTGNVKFYVNGSQQGSTQTGPTSLNSSTQDFRVGDIFSGGSPGNYYFDGNIAQLAVFNKELSSGEISGNYCTQLTGSEGNLIGLWNFNGNADDSTSNGNDLTNNNGVTFPVGAPACISTSSAVRKSTNESVTSSASLQNDDQLAFALGANKTYAVDGVLFVAATSSSATPDFILGFTGPSGSTVLIGADDVAVVGGVASQRLVLPPTATRAIRISGTVVVDSTSGTLQLQWAQSTASASATTVLAGSFLRIEEM